MVGERSLRDDRFLSVVRGVWRVVAWAGVGLGMLVSVAATE